MSGMQFGTNCAMHFNEYRYPYNDAYSLNG